MGNATSSLLLPDLQSGNFMSIGLGSSDSITVFYGGQAEIDAIKNVIIENWSKGLQDETRRNGASNCIRYKLRGRPFWPGGKESAIESRKLAAQILKTLYNMGWKVLVSSDLSRFDDLTTWFFQRQSIVPDTYKFFTIGLSGFDKLQINDCPDNLINIIRECCTSFWPKGIQEQKTIQPTTYEIKLKGYPWNNFNKEDSCAARTLIKEIIQKLSAYQWLLYANSNLKATADTLFFRYDPSLIGGAEFLTISLNKNDRIRLMNMPDSIVSALEEAVTNNWYKGIQEIIDSRPLCYELKLKGHPWWADGQEAVQSRYLIVKIMEKMASLGYYTTTGIDISRKLNDKSLLLFQRGAPIVAPFMCISLNETDKVRFINAPQNVIDAGRQIVSGWALGLQKEEYMQDRVSYQAKLKGRPWMRLNGSDGSHGRALLLRLLNCFTAMGWRLVCSADVSSKFVHQENGPDYPIDVHSWYLMYDEIMMSQQQQMQYPQQNMYPNVDAPPSYKTAIGFN